MLSACYPCNGSNDQFDSPMRFPDRIRTHPMKQLQVLSEFVNSITTLQDMTCTHSDKIEHKRLMCWWEPNFHFFWKDKSHFHPNLVLAGWRTSLHLCVCAEHPRLKEVAAVGACTKLRKDTGLWCGNHDLSHHGLLAGFNCICFCSCSFRRSGAA